jgi:ABC-2 type transport system ATP-binding protein
MNDFAAIQTDRLSKRYGRTEAVCDLSLSVSAHRITGFLGRNGAGKSTTIKMLLGMMQPTGGTGRVLGRNIADPAGSVEIRRNIAFVSEDKHLYGYMTVDQTIRFTSSFYTDWRPDAARELLRKFELPPERKVRSLSKGMRTKLALLLALSRQPKLLILDEPSEGLDPVAVEQLLEILVARSSEGTSVFFSSHQIEEVERIADQICIVDRGRLLVDVSMDEIRRSYRHIDLVFPYEPDAIGFGVPGVERVIAKGRQVRVFSSGNTDEIVERARSYRATAIDIAPVSLRDVFLGTVKEHSDAVV